MGPRGRALGEANRKKLANAMTAGGGGQSDVPAGYTYLGQFVDHDLTFDKTKVTFGQTVSPAQLLQGALPEPGPRLALRRRPAGRRLGASSTRTTAT